MLRLSAKEMSHCGTFTKAMALWRDASTDAGNREKAFDLLIANAIASNRLKAEDEFTKHLDDVVDAGIPADFHQVIGELSMKFLNFLTCNCYPQPPDKIHMEKLIQSVIKIQAPVDFYVVTATLIIEFIKFWTSKREPQTSKEIRMNILIESVKRKLIKSVIENHD